MIWAKQGISLDEITLFDHKISKLYIKWDKKLKIHANAITNLSREESELKLPNINILLRIINNTVEKLYIGHYHTNNQSITIAYEDKKLHIESDRFRLSTRFLLHKESITSEGFSLYVAKLQTTLKGDAVLHKKDNHIAFTTHISLKGDLEADLDIHHKNGIVSIDAKADKITDLGFIRNFIDISPNVSPWIFDKLISKSYTIQKLSSHFPLTQPADFLQNLHAEVLLEDVSYRFDDKLAPLDAPKAKVTFKDVSLYIEAYESQYKDHLIHDTKVELLYLISHPFLKLHFNSKEQLSDDLLTLLANYNLKLPVTQQSGNNDISIVLGLDLMEKKTSVWGDIKLEDAKLQVQGYKTFIHSGHLSFEDNKLIIHPTQIEQDRFHATLSGSFDMQKKIGTIECNTTKFKLASVELQKPLNSRIQILQNGYKIHNGDSSWRLFDQIPLTIQKNSISYLDEKLTFSPVTFLHKERFHALLQGSLDLKKQHSDLRLSVDKLLFQLDNNVSYNLDYPFSFACDSSRGLHFTTDRSVNLVSSDGAISLQQIELSINKGMHLLIDDFRYKDRFRGSLEALYKTLTKSGSIDLSNLSFDLDMTQPTLMHFKKEHLHFDINATEELIIHEPKLSIGYQTLKDTYQLYLDDLGKFIPFSPFMQKEGLEKGKARLITRDFKSFNLFATIENYPVKGYMNPDKNNTIFLAATHDPQKGIVATVNKQIKLTFDEYLNLSLESVDLDLRPFLQTKQEETPKEREKGVRINAHDGKLQLNDQDLLIYDQLNAQVEKDGSIFANLKHQNGQAMLYVQNKRIELFGEKFNDTFISNLISFKGILGGNFDFYIKRDEKKTFGGIKIKDATAKGFALYNNILSFFNTVPALLTFQSPGFNADGFKIKKGHILFEKAKDLVDVKTIKLYGSSSNIFGSGKIDLKKQTIDMSLRIFLLKDMGKILSAVPVAGYILLGDDGSLTTTISIEGKLDNPDISVDLGTDIIMAPLNILKRTITLPLKLFDWMGGNDEKKSDDF